MQQKKYASTSTICRLLIAWIRPVHFDHALEKKHTLYLQVPGLTGQFWVLLELRKSKIPSLRHCNAGDFQTSLYVRNIFMVLLITHNIFLGVGVCQDTMDTIRQSSWDSIHMLTNTGQCSWDICKVYINKYHVFHSSNLLILGSSSHLWYKIHISLMTIVQQPEFGPLGT